MLGDGDVDDSRRLLSERERECSEYESDGGRSPRNTDLLLLRRKSLLGGDTERLGDLRDLSGLGGDRDLERWRGW
jgi:hypothetical protein